MERISGYCIDSDILIDYLRGEDIARDFLVKASKKTQLWISIISVVELYSGRETRNKKKRDSINQFLSKFYLIDLTLPTAQHAGELRRDYSKPFADMIVAATAMAHNLTLVTRNIKHFHEIKGLKVMQPYG